MATDDPFEFDDELEGQFVIDIGVDATEVAGRRPRPPRRSQKPGSPPWRVLGALAAVVAAIAVLVGLLTGGEERAGENRLPPPTSPPEVLPDSVGADPARPEPTTVIVPIVNDGLTRAGETCEVPLEDGNTLTFVVPDGRTMLSCASAGPLLRGPTSDARDALGDVFVSAEPLTSALSQLRADDTLANAVVTWQPVNGRASYRFDAPSSDLGRFDRLHLIDVPGATVFVHGRNRDFADGITESIDQLVASIRVEGPDAVPPPLPQPGGWCAGDHFVTRVPEDWFAGERCRWMNTSSESPDVLECNCFPPLWIEAVDLPLDADYSFSSVDIDRLVTRADGSVIRIIEGLRLDTNNFDRKLRAVIVDVGPERVTVLAAEAPEHVLPGHTWEDTLDAQAFVVDQLRAHSRPECTGPQDRVRISDERPVTVQVITDSFFLPEGTVLNRTGCTDGSLTEVRLEAAPEVVAWLPASAIEPVDIESCPSGERVFRPADWSTRTEGDFDGDGRPDVAYTRNLIGVGSEVAVLFADGGLVESSVELRVDQPPAVERPVGAGRDLVQLVDQRRGGHVLALVDAGDCTIDAVMLGDERGTEVRTGSCRARNGLTEVIRVWEESLDRIRWGWFEETDQLYVPGRGGLRAVEMTGRDPALVCGPRLRTLQPIVTAGSRGTELAGSHPLTLQWVQSRDGSSGIARFEPLGDDRYAIDGEHVGDIGGVAIGGTLERLDADTFRFDGRVVTQIDWLFGGQPCFRNAGQIFERRPGTTVFRMQDRINCDGGRTDWIDIDLRFAIGS